MRNGYFLVALGLLCVNPEETRAQKRPMTFEDILDVKHGIICHQVNCQGVMGAGIAKQIRDKFPTVYGVYRECFKREYLRIGNMHIVPVDLDKTTRTYKNKLIVANLCGQDKYGHDKRHTDYIGLRKAMLKLAKWRRIHHELTGDLLPVYFPHKMGCNLGGGDWYLVHCMIKNIFPNAVIVRR